MSEWPRGFHQVNHVCPRALPRTFENMNGTNRTMQSTIAITTAVDMAQLLPRSRNRNASGSPKKENAAVFVTERSLRRGRRVWFLLYRANGKLKRHTIGTNPPMGLEQARKGARTQLLGVQVEDADPQAAKKARRSADTFDVLAERYRGLREATQGDVGRGRAADSDDVPSPVEGHGGRRHHAR
jgi:hypothetical protein